DNILKHDYVQLMVSPFLISMSIIDMAAGEIAMKYGAKGPNMAHVSACASSAHAIGEATEMIRRGEADVMLAGGSESGLIKVAIGAFNQARALSTRNDAPEKASRPFDKERDGFVFSEGAGCLVLEALDFARARGAKVLGEVIGYGQSSDAHHVTAPPPGGEGAVRAMRMAIEDPRKVRADAKALVSELLERLARDEVRELEVKRGGVRVRVAKDGGPVPARVAGGAITAGAEVNGPATGADHGELPTVSAPLTGVFYRSPSPQAQPYV